MAAIQRSDAFRHGLSLSINSDPALLEEAGELARKIAGTEAHPEMQERARRIAEANIDVRRVRAARHQLISGALSDPDYQSPAMQRKKMAAVVRCARTFGPLTPMPYDVVEFLYWKPEGPCKFATLLFDKAAQLRALERYERRALSRLKFQFARSISRNIGTFWQNEPKKFNAFSTPVSLVFIDKDAGR